MILNCVVNVYKQAARIRRGLAGFTIYEEKVDENEVSISVRVEKPSDIDLVKHVFSAAGATEISEFTEAAA